MKVKQSEPIRPRTATPAQVQATPLHQVTEDSVDIAALDAVIRGLGAAASTHHCCTDDAASQLATLLDVERHAMIAHEERAGQRTTKGHTPSSLHALSSQASQATGPSSPYSITLMSSARTQA